MHSQMPADAILNPQLKLLLKSEALPNQTGQVQRVTGPRRGLAMLGPDVRQSTTRNCPRVLALATSATYLALHVDLLVLCVISLAFVRRCIRSIRSRASPSISRIRPVHVEVAAILPTPEITFRQHTATRPFVVPEHTAKGPAGKPHWHSRHSAEFGARCPRKDG